ncbi:MAG: chitobiase/beta-hexosaminidase C-terminal domain-containing protein, partial [Clostridia bacterium]|nr:chitobiase/beta-hexosaminidase C-terminal domain-containing protein [Clostridia bacterium]
DEDKTLLPDINTLSTMTTVYASDKNVYGNIADGSEVYYTFSDLDAENPVIGDNPETSWVKVSKQNPIIEIDKNTTVRLITNKLGKYSEPAIYYFSIKPLAPTADKPSGEYTEKLDVRLSCATEGAIIYYTIDGSDPKTNGIEYTGIPITLAKDTTLRAISFYDGEWSDKVSYYYLFSFYDDYGVDAFYPSGVYEGSVNVTLTPNNPDYTVMYHIGDGQWKQYTDVLELEEDTNITAKAVEFEADGTTIKSEGAEYVFTYKIKPLPPEFAPESTQFTNANKITIYTPESTESNTDDYDLYFTLDGSDPTTSTTRIHANEASDSAVIDITKYTVVTAAVLKNGESWSSVVKHSYDIVTLKPVKPLTTLLPGYYIHEIGGEGFATQFMPVPQGTQIYYTISYDGGLCPDPVPNTAGTYLYDGTAFIDIKGNTVIKAVAVNVFGVKSDVGIFSYTVTPQAPKAAPSATINEAKLPVIPVDAVKGSTVNYKIGSFENEFINTDDERFYIDTETGMAYRDEECTEQLGSLNTGVNSGSVTLEISSTLDGVESDTNRYTYAISNSPVLAPPYADKETGTYEERKIDDDNNILKVMLNSLNSGGKIQYRIDNEGEWKDYDGNGLLFKEDTILQLRYAKNGNYSSVVSYVYNFVPLAPIIELPSGTYLESDGKTTTIGYDDNIPTDKNYSIWYRQNGDNKDFRYTGQERAITHTMSFKAYVLNENTGRVSKNTIHYYIIESGSAASGSVYIAYPYDADRISAHLLGTGDYAEGIKLLSQNKTADIHYYYTYTKKSDGQTITTNTAVYDVTRPIIPTALMDDITIYAWLEDEDGKIEGSDGTFKIDFVHLDIPTTSLEASGKVEFSKGTKYTLKDYPTDENVILYYTLDGSDPSISDNANRKAYSGEELTLNSATTVKVVYFSACGKCKDITEIANCHDGVYGQIGTYKYTIPTTINTGGGGGGGGGSSTIVKQESTLKIFSEMSIRHTLVISMDILMVAFNLKVI